MKWLSSGLGIVFLRTGVPLVVIVRLHVNWYVGLFVSGGDASLVSVGVVLVNISFFPKADFGDRSVVNSFAL